MTVLQEAHGSRIMRVVQSGEFADVDEEAHACFIDLIPSRMAEVEKLMQAADNECKRGALIGVAKIIHQLAGTAKTLGMHQIDFFCREAETRIRASLEAEQWQSHLSTHVEEIVEALLDALEHEFFS